MSADKSFTGKARRRSTRPLVLFLDKLAKFVITIGGIGTMVAVAMVCLFLVWVVVPLFLSPSVENERVVDALAADSGEALVHFAVDDQRNLTWSLDRQGLLRVRRLDGGALIDERRLFAKAPSAFSIPSSGARFGFGFDDGNVVFASIAWETEFLDRSALPESVEGMERGERRVYERGIVEYTPQGDYRHRRLQIEVDESIATGSSEAVLLIDQTETVRDRFFCALTADGVLHARRLAQKRNMLTDTVEWKAEGKSLDVSVDDALGLKMTALGDNVFLAYVDGRCLRFDTRDIFAPSLVETVDLIPEDGRRLSCLEFALGRQTLLAGDSEGAVGVWFGTKPEHAASADGITLRRARVFDTRGSAVLHIGGSARSRISIVSRADGSLQLIQVSNGDELLYLDQLEIPNLEAASIAPKDDALYAAGSGSVQGWSMDIAHPEATVGSLFGKLWYEGYVEPQHVWQSSSGDDDTEPKYGLIPLIFGSLKATLYSLLFGVPIAILAAIYTSEFLEPRAKAKIKPAIEFMAGLPSVVLGFVAALVIAPLVQDRVPALLVSFFLVPVIVLLAAHLWQLLPNRERLRRPRLGAILMTLTLPVAVVLSLALGPVFESLLFAGNIKLWLDGQMGGPTGGFFLILIPFALGMSILLWSRFGQDRYRDHLRGLDERAATRAELLRFLGMVAATCILAVIFAALLSAFGFDPRGSVVDTYVQRNALIVGFIMGFAIIPIIYTIADDALSTVPQHLRAASLGAGATRWQTALRIVIPTAMSGLFSAVMIGLGRAVGETMIVLMAAGNTPVMDLNIFNGFRTLSANIAVELPEAVKDSTHYRTLFLAALVLFAITFVLNTVAELVRQSFRKRAYQL